MKLTSKGRYAVMALVDLARFDNINPVSLRDISLRQGISLDYLEQIFSKLRKKEIVQSVRGTQGGYVLNKKAETIQKLSEEIDISLGNTKIYYFKELNCNKVTLNYDLSRIINNIEVITVMIYQYFTTDILGRSLISKNN